MPKLPSFQFYPGDWMKDPALRSVSLAARGLYVEMLCVMWESEERGVLPYARKAEAKALAKVVGHRTDFVAKLLRELELSRVISRRQADHRIYSRRLVREELERKRTREWHQNKSREKNVNQEADSRPFPDHSSSSSSSSNLRPPLPPVNGGTLTHDDLLKDENNYSYMGWSGGHIIIRTGRHKRVLTQRDIEGLAGARIEQVVELIRRRGFWAEIYVPSTEGKAPL